MILYGIARCSRLWRCRRSMLWKPVDPFWLKSVDRCSKPDADRHQCDPPKLIELSTSKSPSCSFSCFTTYQKSSSMMAFTWCFIASSPTPLAKFWR
ncbi:hypothetical protein F2Q68_00015573 [Brassica cretica]|uniref:Uncharacterized protein n=2 Tax=Brassica cretica TaxID=69181 RepID=A0ABQ7F5E2_BRACR|nr:hypothetical protein F2Q68_00015573 [Brassica cretica]KAF3610979.1 hypothetical protein DY000_02048182 [Brassica cretica]